MTVRVFANGLGDLGSVPGQVIPKTQKMVLDASLLNSQHYKVRNESKMKQYKGGIALSSSPLCIEPFKKEASKLPTSMVGQLIITSSNAGNYMQISCIR